MRLVIFDVDGTLVDSQDGIVEAQNRALAAYGFAPPARDKALSVVGLSLGEAFAALVGPDAPLDDLAQTYKVAWTELRRCGYRDALYPGAAQTIAALADDPSIRLGIATGKSRVGIDRILAAEGWAGVFATIQTADTHPSKPHPSMVRAAMAETQASAAATIVVGDTSYDMDMARAAGTQPIGVAWGYHPRAKLLTSGAARIAEDFGHLQSILHTLRNGTA